MPPTCIGVVRKVTIVKKVTTIILLLGTIGIVLAVGSTLALIADVSEYRPNFLSSSQPVATVHVFLKEDCPISRYHTKTLSQLHLRYAKHGIVFHGYVSSTRATKQSVAAFRAKFDIPFIVEPDASLEKAHHLGAKVTPEVVLFNQDGKKLYQGRIDNTYADFGKRRRVTTSHDLRDVLTSLSNGEAVEPKSTEAIGCLIPFAKFYPFTKS